LNHLVNSVFNRTRTYLSRIVAPEGSLVDNPFDHESRPIPDQQTQHIASQLRAASRKVLHTRNAASHRMWKSIEN
jgi:hypothetical protein